MSVELEDSFIERKVECFAEFAPPKDVGNHSCTAEKDSLLW